jgi:2-amino-4-hydroxy-6-hydroxymethyldihydropteridine diphosphokinase
MMRRRVYLSLGSNLGDRRKNLNDALDAIGNEKIHLVKSSSLYETAPQDVVDQPWFLNMVVQCETDYFPVQLLSVLQRVEREMGRKRVGVPPRGPRLIDIDILLYGDVQIKTPRLEIPHPRMLGRRFVLEPLLEIAPDLPYAHKLRQLADQPVKRLDNDPPGQETSFDG